MDVENFAQMPAMAEHSMCQPGRPGMLIPLGEGHDGSPGGLHSASPSRRACGCYIHARARLKLAEGPVRELAVVGHRWHVEEHVALSHRTPFGHERLDQRLHLLICWVARGSIVGVKQPSAPTSS
jgi:hypothetical protein